MAQVKIVAEQLKSESMNDYVKFLVFLQIGSNRSLDEAYKRYYETNEQVSERWQTLSKDNRWVDRAVQYDKAAEHAPKGKG